MVEVDVNGMTIYSIEKIRLKKDDILIFVFNGRLSSESLKHYMDNLPDALKNKVLCIDNGLKVVHVDNETIEEIDMEENK